VGESRLAKACSQGPNALSEDYRAAPERGCRRYCEATDASVPTLGRGSPTSSPSMGVWRARRKQGGALGGLSQFRGA